MTVWTADSPYVCGWSFDDSCAPKIAATITDPNAEGYDPDRVAMVQRCINTAAEILYGLSGRRYGLCETTIRPCRPACCDPCDRSGPRWTPALVGGQWINVSCNRCGDGCSCPEICDVVLPGPVHDITEVKLDGQILPPTAYRVDNRRALVALTRPMPEEGALVLAYAFLDPNAAVCVDVTPTAVPVGTPLGGNCYAPVGGIIQLRFEGLGTEGVTVEYSGPAEGFTALSYPSQAVNEAGEAFLFDPFVWVPGDTIHSVGIEDFGQQGNDDATATITLLSGTPTIFNAPRNQAIQGDFSARYQAINPGRFCWPTCQDMTANSDQPGTWEVTYHRGLPLPAAGSTALGRLADELCLACLGDDCCALPKRVTSINREGVSYTILDPQTFLEEGRTGIYEIDLWLRAVNPHGRTRGAAILSPDMPQARRTTWQA